MKWFKHFTKIRFDHRMLRIIKKHGLAGYGLYMACIESIAFDLDADNPTIELESNCNDIASFFGEDTIEIETIVKDLIKEGLLDMNAETNKIACLSLIESLDNTLSQNPQIKGILDNFKKLKGTLSPLKQIRLDESTLDKSTEEKSNKKRFVQPTINELQDYATSINYITFKPQSFIDYYESTGWLIGKKPMKNWQAAVRTWKHRDADAAPVDPKSAFRKEWEDAMKNPVKGTL